MNVNITSQQIGMGASALIELLGKETTLVPGNLRAQIAVFEVVLNGIVDGQFAVVPVTRTPVESDSDTGKDDAGAKTPKKPVKTPKKPVKKTPAKPKR